MAKIDLKKFFELVDQRRLSVQKHDTEALLVWNYTHSEQYAKNWIPETMMARGLITDIEGNILARPFTKFFNYEEHFGDECKLPPLPLEPFTVYDKLDGSLGILYWINNIPYLATRGSFNSDQAKVGTEILHKYDWSELNKNYTYLFEIIYPENRIVVDYKGRRDIILLAVIDTETGEEKDLYEECGQFPFIGVVAWGDKPIENLKGQPGENKEGFVIRFKSGVRCKIKFDEYVRLHRLVTGVNAKTIWELLMHNQPFDELLERVPDEFYAWVKKTKIDLEETFKEIESSALATFDEVKDIPTRKEQAEYINFKGEFPGVSFALLDKKPYAERIWKLIRPKAEKPYKEDIDA